MQKPGNGKKSPNLLWPALLTWFILALVAIINGSVRNFAYRPLVGELPAHQISTVTFCLLLLSVVYLFVRMAKPADRQLLPIGLSWAALTGAFEFLFGHYVVGHPWSTLLADYNLGAGRLWLVVLAMTIFSPLIARKIFKA
ncbi:MAG: hypothetical protein MUC35_01800 [Candidatus Margulisbacteria bacterium]|jgi:hypothetical protein|nr:hypothetical protein [Candidatus Margulisiibacteriota bacterium]